MTELPIEPHVIRGLDFVGWLLLLALMIFILAHKYEPIVSMVKQLQVRLNLDPVNTKLFTLLLLTFGGLALATGFQFVKATLGLTEFAETASQSEAIRNTGLALAAVIGVPFLIWRSIVAQKQVDVAEQGQITDRISKAVEGLGAEKTVKKQRQDNGGNLTYEKDGNGKPIYSKPLMIEVSQPNLEVRIGALYSLERIAQDSDRDHEQIMEILCAYVRQNAPLGPPKPLPKEYTDKIAGLRHKGKPDLMEHEKASDVAKKIRCWVGELRKPREDISVALTVLGRRTQRQISLEHGFYDRNGEWQGFRLNLRDTNLTNCDLSGYNFRNVDFSGSDLRGAILTHTELQCANFRVADLTGANLVHAKLQGTIINETLVFAAVANHARFETDIVSGRSTSLNHSVWELASLQNTDFSGAWLSPANFGSARLDRAKFNFNLNRTSFFGAYLYQANFSGCHLWQVDFSEAFFSSDTRFHGAVVKNSKFRNAINWKEAKFRGSAWLNEPDKGISSAIKANSEVFNEDDFATTDFIREDYFERWKEWQVEIGFDPNDPTTWDEPNT
ncbi:Secreted effector protein pipB2 [Falsiruegeria litorea R37]|uniref:Secreted effector protein pipB2 n=1 Tax=Falsiruegeria litorea R37 TaxID=1200284 RepID=A0A1Y5SPV1_9RHOB|nr:pentapeptide repeat-containing protein [Falsiruegeria litorea]SLN45600.1 Secreted effector protein pipB2 [Falsiruegeria litorea R37]